MRMPGGAAAPHREAEVDEEELPVYDAFGHERNPATENLYLPLFQQALPPPAPLSPTLTAPYKVARAHDPTLARARSTTRRGAARRGAARNATASPARSG
jgi:hypothetical protein